jgi:hypothetical protein
VIECVDFVASNHTHPTLTTSLPGPSFCSPFIVVGICSTLTVILVGDSVLLRPFYLTDVLVSPNLIQSLLFVCCFTTNNSFL